MNRTLPNENDTTFYIIFGSGTAVLITKIFISPQLMYDIFLLSLLLLLTYNRIKSQQSTKTDPTAFTHQEGAPTNEAELYSNLIQIEKFKSLSFVISAFAHEINNPLTGILGTADIIKKSRISPEALTKRADFIEKQALRISSIIDKLNHLQPEMMQTKLQLDLNNLLEKLQKIIRIHYKNTHIEFQPSSTSIILTANHYSLWHIFESILKNCIEAEIHDLKITMSTSIINNNAEILIKDNGNGFEDINKAFDPFYTTKDRTLHKGIGLSIAYTNVMEHNGKISLANNNGAELKITLPLANKSNSSEITNTGGE